MITPRQKAGSAATLNSSTKRQEVGVSSSGGWGVFFMSAPPGCGLLIFTDTLTAAVLIRINSAANYNAKVINASVKMCQPPRLHDGKAQQGKMKNKRFFLFFYVCLFHTAFLFLPGRKKARCTTK